jgi:hypothetical protein
MALQKQAVVELVQRQRGGCSGSADAIDRTPGHYGRYRNDAEVFSAVKCSTQDGFSRITLSSSGVNVNSPLNFD